MRNFKEKMYRFMYGRYGTDNLYRFLMVTALILIVAHLCVGFLPESVGRTVARNALSLAVFAVYVWMLFRTMSRNIYKRRRENEIYLKASRAVLRFLSGNTASRGSIRDDAYYIFRTCTKCGSTLRLPKRVGKHRVKCPKCGHGFYVKAK